MAMTRQERIELHDRLVAMLDGVRKDLMARFPEVMSVDLGLKVRGDELTSEFSWRVFVKEKKAESDLKPEEMIPREIKGIPTDVQVYRVNRALEDTGSYDTLMGGIQITGAGGTGSLGCFVTVGSGSKIHLLSNHHVLLGGGSAGALVGQPWGACDLCCCKCCDVAEVTAGFVGVTGTHTDNKIDAAIAVLRGQDPADSRTVAYSNSIVDIGPIFGSGTVIPTDTVRKRGRSTELTTGTVTSTTYSPGVDYGTSTSPAVSNYNDCIEVNGTGSTPIFAKGGDSGSALVNDSGQVVGLVFAGDDTVTAVCKFSNISTRFGGLTVQVSGTSGTVPHIAHARSVPLVAAHPANFLQVISEKLKKTPEGEEFLSAVRENHREVLDLINDHREVKVAWNRFQGPAFVGHLAKNANEPGHPIPPEVNGYTLQHLLIKMNDVLERHGSRKLARAVEDYSRVAFRFANEYSGIDSIDPILEREGYCPNCGTLKTGKHYA